MTSDKRDGATDAPSAASVTDASAGEVPPAPPKPPRPAAKPASARAPRKPAAPRTAASKSRKPAAPRTAKKTSSSAASTPPVAVPGPPPPLPTAIPSEPKGAEASITRAEKPPVPPLPPLPPHIIPVAENETPSSAEPDETPDAPESQDVVDDVVVVEPVEVVASVEVVEAVELEERSEAVEEPSVETITDEAVLGEDSVGDTLLAEPELETEPEIEPVSVVDPAVLAVPVEAGDITSDDADLEAPAPALALRGVVKQFGEMRAVDAIDLTIPTGSFFGLVGPNGAGKTTTLSMIAGLLRPDAGTIEVCGIDAAADPSRAKKLIGVLPDRLRTFDRLTGRQLLYYYGVLRGLSSSVVQSRIADLARAFDLVDALGRVVSDYSAGMTKKIMLAGAMIHSPRVLVLDEPFESLDPASSQVILDILETYVAHGGTVVLSSHGMGLVERVCTRVAVLVEGEVLASGTVDEVRGELTLEQRFIELSGGVDDAEGLEWLHTFSD